MTRRVRALSASLELSSLFPLRPGAHSVRAYERRLHPGLVRSPSLPVPLDHFRETPISNLTPDTTAAIDQAGDALEYIVGADMDLKQVLPDGRWTAAIVHAMAFMPPWDPTGEQQQTVFGPSLAGPDGQYPAPLESTPQDRQDEWSELAEALRSPVLTSRLHDLLWELRHGAEYYKHAQSAIDALLDVARTPSLDEGARIGALDRALQLALHLRDDDRATVAAEAIFEHAEAALARGEPEAWIAVRAVALLGGTHVDDAPRIADLLERAAEAAQDRHDERLALDLLFERAEEYEREAIARRLIASLEADADDSSGFRRRIRLDEAIDIARRASLTAEAERLSVLAQAIPEDEYGFVTVSGGELDITEVVEQLKANLDNVDDLARAVVVLSSHPLPIGPEDDIRAYVLAAQQAHPVLHLLGGTVSGPYGETIWEMEDDEDKLRHGMRDHESTVIKVWGQVVGIVLSARLRDEEGEFECGSLHDILQPSERTSWIVDRLCDALRLFAEGRYDAAGHVVFPRIEAALRELCLAVGLPLHVPPAGERPGGVKLLGAMIDMLDRSLPDPAMARYLRTLLIDPLGLNLRNKLAHGLQSEAAGIHAALLIDTLLRVLLLRPNTAPMEQADEANELESP